MTADQFRSALRTTPFRPFTVHTGSGEACKVTHPETVGISPSGQTVVIVQDSGTAILDMESITEYVVSNPTRRAKKE
jgi:hypothetical protein